jgi:hypothetical protein
MARATSTMTIASEISGWTITKPATMPTMMVKGKRPTGRFRSCSTRLEASQ